MIIWITGTIVYYKGPSNKPSSSDQPNFPPAQANVQNPHETVRFMIVLCFGFIHVYIWTGISLA